MVNDAIYKFLPHLDIVNKNNSVTHPTSFSDSICVTLLNSNSFYIHMVLAASRKDSGSHVGQVSTHHKHTSPFTSDLPGEMGKSVQDGSLMSPGAFSWTQINSSVSWRLAHGLSGIALVVDCGTIVFR